MDTITQQFNRPIKQVRDNFFEVLKKNKIEVLGQNDELGLVSFEKNDRLFYAHFAEGQNNETKIGIAPGLSYMKDRDGFDPTIIKEIINEMGDKKEL